ncbi:DUF3267 domain-containing protein [Georgenia sp. Marseille-Q6866]
MAHRSVRPRRIDLPDSYRLHSTLDLKDDKRAATTIKVAFALTVAAMITLALVLDLPFQSTLSTGASVSITVVACLAYMVVHELTHAALLWWLTRERPTVGVRFPYLITGSQAFLTRGGAVVVALTPLVLYTLVLLDLLRSLPPEFFLTVYVVLVLNVAGSAGDVLQARAFLRLPPAALIRDDGEETSVFLPAETSPVTAPAVQRER